MPAAILIPLIISGASMAGQMALSFFTRPKQPPVEKGKFDDIRITGSDYGTRILRGWGKYRSGGQIIFASGITDYVITTGGGGGKGGGGPVTNTHTYKASFGVLIGRGGIANVLRIWDDVDLVVSNPTIASHNFEAELATLAGGATIVNPDATASGNKSVTNLGNGGKATFDFTSVADPIDPSLVPPGQTGTPYTRVSFYYKCVSDRDAVITTVDPDNGTVFQTFTFPGTGTDWTVLTIEFSGFLQTLKFENPSAAAPDLDLVSIEKYFLYTGYSELSFNVSGAVNESIAYPKDLDNPSEYYNKPLTLTKDPSTGIYSITTPIPGQTVRIYTGTESQTQDAAIIAYLDQIYGTGEGVLRASAMRGLDWVMFQDYTLKAPRSPNFTFEVDTGDNTTNKVLSDLFADVGLVSSDYDLSATSAYTQVGFVETTGGSRKQYAEYLGNYHQFRLAEIDGKIRSIPDSSTSLATLDRKLLRAHTFGSQMPLMDADVVIKEETLMPREVVVGVMNPDLDYKNEPASAPLFTVQGTETLELNFPVVDRLPDARLKAERLVLKTYFEDKEIEIQGMPELARYAVGDTITIPCGNVNILARIEKKKMGLPVGVVTLNCVSTGYTATGIFQSDTTAFAPKAALQAPKNTFPRNSIIVPIQSEPIFERDRGNLGLYLAVCGRGRGSGQPAAIYREFGASNYVLQSKVEAVSPVGIGKGTLATWSPLSSVDTTNSLTIMFFDDIELESVTSGDIITYPTLNLMRVGGEWLQFQTAVAAALPDNSTYRSSWTISNLTRGVFGTAAAVPAHAADEYCSLVTPAIMFFPLEKSDIDTDINLKAVTSGQDIDVAPVISFHFNQITAYTISNRTTDRAYDANATTINELADVVSTIIEDMNL